jgi:hypothetical protein
MTRPEEFAASAACIVIALVAGSLAGCDNPPSPAPPAPAATSAAPLYVPPPPEGCARTGSLEGVESDPTCVVARSDDTSMRDAMKHLTFDLAADNPVVMAGSQVILRLSITNTAAAEVALLFDEQPPSATPRPDWSRLAGVPEPKPAASGMPAPEGYRLIMPVRTLDAHEHGVDGLPVTSATGGSTPVVRPLRVRLRPGGKLTQNFTWWAMRIPAPAPITRDDAGHRFVPKTAPVPLPAGEYVVDVELPLHGISPPESVVSTRVRVEKVEKPGKADAAPP